MKKSLRYMALTGAGLLVLGLLLSLCGFFTGGTPWIYADRTGVHVGDTAKRNVQISEELAAFQELQVDVSMADVYVVAGDRYAIDIQYTDSYDEPRYSLEGGVLKVWDQEQGGSSGWRLLNFNLMGLTGSGSDKVVITVPSSASLRQMELCSDMGGIQCAQGAEKLLLNAALGDIVLKDFQAGQVTVTADCGSCEVAGVTADSLELSDNLGSAIVERVRCASFTADMDNGTLTVRDSSLGRSNVESSLGDVIFEQVSTDGLEAQCDNGSMDLTGAFAGKSRLLNSLGNIRVTTSLPQESCRYEIALDLGSAYVNGEQVQGGQLFGGLDSAANRIEVQADLGSVWISFP